MAPTPEPLRDRAAASRPISREARRSGWLPVAAILALAAAGATATACGEKGAAAGTGGQVTTSSGAGGAGATANERDAANTGSDSSSSLGQLLSVADSMFSFDPTIDPTKSASANAASIAAKITAALGGCGTVKVSGATVTASFGAPPGCTLMLGVTVSGTVIAAVTTSGGTVTIALTLESLIAGGKALSGTASFATSNGTSFAVTTNLVSGTTTQTASLTVTGSSTAFVINGTASSIEGGVTTMSTFKSVVWQPGQCYPQAGSLEVAKGATTLTMTFSASTPSTGEVEVTAGKRSYPLTLPAYGSCGGDGG